MSSRFDAHTSVLELPGIGPRDVSLLQRLRVFTWGDLVALDSAAAVGGLRRSTAADVAAVERLRTALGLATILERAEHLLPIDAWGGLHIFGAEASAIRTALEGALRPHGLRARPFVGEERPLSDLQVFSTIGPDRIAIAREGGDRVALLSERLEGCPVEEQPLLPLLAPTLLRGGAAALLAYRYIPDLFATPPSRDLLLVCGDGRPRQTFGLRWARGEDPTEMARVLSDLGDRAPEDFVAALEDDEPLALARALRIEHLGFRTFLEDTLSADEEPDVLEFVSA